MYVVKESNSVDELRWLLLQNGHSDYDTTEDSINITLTCVFGKKDDCGMKHHWLYPFAHLVYVHELSGDVQTQLALHRPDLIHRLDRYMLDPILCPRLVDLEHNLYTKTPRARKLNVNSDGVVVHDESGDAISVSLSDVQRAGIHDWFKGASLAERRHAIMWTPAIFQFVGDIVIWEEVQLLLTTNSVCHVRNALVGMCDEYVTRVIDEVGVDVVMAELLGDASIKVRQHALRKDATSIAYFLHVATDAEKQYAAAHMTTEDFEDIFEDIGGYSDYWDINALHNGETNGE